MARPTKLDDKLQKRLADAIKLGMSRERAAYFCGITRQTFQGWLSRGEKAKAGKFKAFFDTIKKAESEAIGIHLKNIHNASAGGAWQASAWMLERRYPKEYGKNRTDDEPGTAKSIADAISIIRGEKKEEGED